MRVPWFCVALIASALVACGGGQSTTSSTQTAPLPLTSAHAMLLHVPNGTATLTYLAAGKTLAVDLQLVGLAPNSTHPAYIRTGDCAHAGAVAYPLPVVTAGVTGVAHTTGTLHVTEPGIPASGWYLVIHNGPALTPDEQLLPLVCGNIAASGATATVALKSGPPGAADQTASASADFTISNSTLTVKVTAHGLSPSTVHPINIRAGTCAKEGPVEYTLLNLTSDASGDATLTGTVPHVTAIGQWYITVHRTTRLATPVGYDPILCGDVVP